MCEKTNCEKNRKNEKITDEQILDSMVLGIRLSNELIQKELEFQFSLTENERKLQKRYEDKIEEMHRNCTCNNINRGGW